MTDLLSADFGIRQLHARLSDAVWRQDDQAFSGCFAADGEWKIAGLAMQGREAIAEGCRNLLGRCRRIHLITSQPILELSNGGALGRLSMTEFAIMNDGSTAMTIGYYHDRYVEEGGFWLFAARHWSVKYRGPPDLTGAFMDTPDYGSFPGRPSPDETTFVRKA